MKNRITIIVPDELWDNKKLNKKIDEFVDNMKWFWKENSLVITPETDFRKEYWVGDCCKTSDERPEFDWNPELNCGIDELKEQDLRVGAENIRKRVKELQDKFGFEYIPKIEDVGPYKIQAEQIEGILKALEALSGRIHELECVIFEKEAENAFKKKAKSKCCQEESHKQETSDPMGHAPWYEMPPIGGGTQI